MNRPKFPKSAGFTILELLVAMTIVVILAGISVPVYQRVQNSGKKKIAQANVRLISLKLSDFRLDNDFIPTCTFISGKEPEDTDTGTYDADPTAGAYLKSARVLFLALTGTSTFGSSAPGSAYLKPTPEMVANADELSGEDLDSKNPKTYLEHNFEQGSYLIDPWGNPYGFYFNPDNSQWNAFHSPSTFDLWSTGEQTESDQRSRNQWITSWAKVKP